jgi:hypothetical protein
MSVNDEMRIDVTRDKLRLLEKTYAEAELDHTGTAHSRELTLRSLKQLINQLKEEIARHATRAGTTTQTP